MDDVNRAAPGDPADREVGTIAVAGPGGLDQRYLHNGHIRSIGIRDFDKRHEFFETPGPLSRH